MVCYNLKKYISENLIFINEVKTAIINLQKGKGNKLKVVNTLAGN